MSDVAAQILLEQLSRGNNTISYSRDRSVTETTTSLSINKQVNQPLMSLDNSELE
jgi:hypothetical protein